MITAIWILAFLLVVWTALAWLPEGLSGHMPLPYMIALIPFLWIPLLAVGVWAGALQQWAACVLCLVWMLASLNSFAQYNRTRLPAFVTGSSQRNGREVSKPYPGAKTDANAITGPNDSDSGAATDANAEATNNATDSASSSSDRTSYAAAFHVMTLNCRYGRANAEAIVNAVRGRSIDVLALQECTDDLMTALDAAGLAALMPYCQFGESKDTDNGGFNALFTRIEPVGFQRQAVVIPAADVPAITLEIPASKAISTTTTTSATATNSAASGERRITFASAHPKSPMRGCAEWAAGIMGLSELARTAAQGDHDIAVIMGDLNSQYEHTTFRRLLAAGFTDASLSEGKGRNTTYPRWLPWPRIELDHILTTAGAQPSEVESFPVEGTDHLALTATLTV